MTQRLEETKRTYFRQIRQIAAEILDEFEELHDADRTMLQDMYDARKEAQLHIRDLEKSAEAYFKLTLLEIQQFRDGVMAIRPEVLPSQFKQLPVYTPEEFPVVTELDDAVEEAEAAFALRTEQLAKLEEEVGALELAAMEEFPALIDEIMNAGERQRAREQRITRQSGEIGEATP